MREIKFRAWDKEWKRMVELGRPRYHEGVGGVLMYAPHQIKWDNNELMQYTGLKDKNGVEIYEGDIISDKYMYSPEFSSNMYEEEDVRVVKTIYSPLQHWSVNNSAYWEFEEVEKYYAEGSKKYGCEVIGNIYENPELLDK